MNIIEISLFPIPGSVSLPFSTVPLHVFEPRYRKMIKDSILDKRRIGVSHTKRIIAGKKINTQASLEVQLSTNQESYEAYPVFSAGFAEILETLPDGRLIVQITMDSRYEMYEEVQQVPYKIVRCREYEDSKSENHSSFIIKDLRKTLDQIFIGIATQNTQQEEMINFIKSEKWQEMSDEEYSFSIYSLVLFEPETMQKILELTSALERITWCLQTLRSAGTFFLS